MTPTDPRLQTTDARRASNRLLDVLQRERIADDKAAPGPGISAEAALIEQAKGALMAYFGVDSHQASEVLIGWARTSHSLVPTIAYTLLHGICEGDPQTEARHRPLVRWLETQLREGGPHHAQLRTAPTRCSPAQETPRPAVSGGRG
jgi:hypothetical protein